MFEGTVPGELRSIVGEAAKAWDTPEVYVGCSGNFTIERVLREGRVLHGNDVQLYSCAVGAYLAGQDFPLGIRPEHQPDWGWLLEYMDTPERALATVMLSTRMLQGYKQENDYRIRIRDGFRRQWPTLHSKAVERLDEPPVRLESFYSGDVMEFIDFAPTDSTFVCFPPFFKGDYESMYAALDEVFEWPAPEYEVYDPDEALRLLIDKARERKHWLIGTQMRQDDLKADLLGIVQTTNRGVPIYVYGSGDTKRLVAPRQDIEPVLMRRLQPGESVEPPIRLAELTGGQFRALRSQYMNESIKPGEPTLVYGVLAGDRLIGSFAFQTASDSMSSFEKYLPEPSVYLLSDFPVAPVTEDRLAKLIVMCAMSSEAKRLAERSVSGRIRSIVTTARTKRAVSMKYRGPMRLLSRKDDEDFGHALNYGAEMGQWTLAEAYERWRSASK